MRKVFDIMKQTNGDNFEIIVKENGERVYRSWQSMKIAIDGGSGGKKCGSGVFR